MHKNLLSRWALGPCVALLLLCCTLPALSTTIHAGDQVFIKVWNHPDLSKQVVVDADGLVRVPLSGAVAISGLDEAAASKKLADALRPYIVYPSVDVQTIQQGGSIFVSGGPGGVLKYFPGESLAAAIADALQAAPVNTSSLSDVGPSLAKVDLHHVGLQRDGRSVGVFDAVSFGVNGDPGPVVEPGDTIVFNYKPIQVRVIGNVAHPGIAYLTPDQSMSDAISQLGGVLPTAVTNHVTLTRDGVVQSLALGDPLFSLPAKSGDEISVPTAPRINVVGTVTTPGVVTLKTDPTLISAMYAAGGPTRLANLKYVSVVRPTGTTVYDVTLLTHGNLTQNPVLHDGDTVVIPEGHKFDYSSLFTVLGGFAAGIASRI